MEVIHMVDLFENPRTQKSTDEKKSIEVKPPRSIKRYKSKKPIERFDYKKILWREDIE
jgi:hypothetical protein